MNRDLAAQLADVPPENGRVCKFGPWLLSLKEDDYQAVVKAMGNPELPTRHIFKVLKSIGCPSAESSIRSHRARECQHCERELHGKP